MIEFTSPEFTRWRIIHTEFGAVGVAQGSGNSSSNIIGVSDQLMESAVLYHIEVKLVQHPTQGSIEIRVNGSTWLLVEDLNTSSTIGGVGLMGQRTGGSALISRHYIDNLYIWDHTGAENNDWLGERVVYTLMPDKDGPTQDWTLSTGSDTYALLDEIPDDTATYIQAADIDDIAQIGFEALPSLDITPIGVLLTGRGSKTGTAVTEVGLAITGETPTPNPMTQDQFLGFAPPVYELNPATGLPWTPSQINAIQVDIKRLS
jgi:hypothetical protein